MPGVLNLFASLKGSGAAAATTWSATNHGSNITLSNSNLTAALNIALSGPFSGRTDTSISGTQKIYGELSSDISSSSNNAIGFANASWTFTDGNFTGGDTFSLGYYGSGAVFVNFVQIASIGTHTQGAIIGWAVDFAAGKIWFTLNGTTWNNDILANQNPVGGIGGIPITISGPVFPCYQVTSSGVLGQWTADFGATTFTYSTLYTTLQGAGYSHL